MDANTLRVPIRAVHTENNCGGQLVLNQPELTSNHTLLFTTYCMKCSELAYFEKSLTECWNSCPKSPAAAPPPAPGTIEKNSADAARANAATVRAFDDGFLKELGIKMPTER